MSQQPLLGLHLQAATQQGCSLPSSPFAQTEQSIVRSNAQHPSCLTGVQHCDWNCVSLIAYAAGRVGGHQVLCYFAIWVSWCWFIRGHCCRCSEIARSRAEGTGLGVGPQLSCPISRWLHPKRGTTFITRTAERWGFHLFWGFLWCSVFLTRKSFPKRKSTVYFLAGMHNMALWLWDGMSPVTKVAGSIPKSWKAIALFSYL